MKTQGTFSKYIELYTMCCGNNIKYRKTIIGTSMREKTKMDINWPPLNGYLSEIRF